MIFAIWNRLAVAVGTLGFVTFLFSIPHIGEILIFIIIVAFVAMWVALNMFFSHVNERTRNARTVSSDP